MTDVTFEPDFEVELEPEDMDVEFAPGCFDDFKGTQEELDALIEELKRQIKTGEFFENSKTLTEEEFEELTRVERNIQ